MALAHGLPVTTAASVRESPWPIAVIQAPVGPDALHAAVLDAVRADRDIDAAGTLAVIAVQDRVLPVLAALSADPALDVGLGAQGLTAPIVVLSPTEAKGLEFDAVVIVDPTGIVDAMPRGAAALYVAMTRPTQRLTLVALGELPTGLL